MFNYSFNPREYNEILQFVTLFLLVVIGVMIYFMTDSAEKLENELSNIEMSCPECPEHPDIPSCPKCPDLTCTEEGKCPDCVCPNNEHSCPKCPDSNHTCPQCPQCPDPPQCPTVDEIIGGIFPGRNAGITSGGRYFNIQANESYELMPDYDFYQPIEAFPHDSILDPLHTGNVRVPPDSIDNSIDNNNINTMQSRSAQYDSVPRMNMPPPGSNTSPNAISGTSSTRRSGARRTGSRAFGSGTERRSQAGNPMDTLSVLDGAALRIFATREGITQEEINATGCTEGSEPCTEESKQALITLIVNKMNDRATAIRSRLNQNTGSSSNTQNGG